MANTVSEQRDPAARATWLRYVVAVGSIAIAVALRWLLNPQLDLQLPFITMFGAVALTVWFGGWRPALIATVLGFFAANYFFIEPRFGFAFDEPAVWAGCVGYAISCGFIVFFGEALRQSRASAESHARRQQEEMRERQRAQEALAASEHFNRTIIESSRDCIKTLGLDGTLLWVSEQGQRQLCIPDLKEVIGQSWIDFWSGDDRVAARAAVETALSGGTGEFCGHFPIAGESRWWDVVISPILDERGKPERLLAVSRDVSQRKRADAALGEHQRTREALYQLANALQRTTSLDDIYRAAVDAITAALACDRASVLLFDENNAMRFVAARGLSDEYRAAVEGHSPWAINTRDPKPIHIDDVAQADLPNELKQEIQREGLGALGFIPLLTEGRLIGKFMVYFDAPHAFSAAEIETAMTLGRQLAFSIDRQRAAQLLARSEERLRLATQTGKVGAWEWDVTTNKISWSDSLYAIHGVARETFPGTVEAFAELVHPLDRNRVSKAIERSLSDGVPYELMFRAVKPDGNIIWLFTNAIVLQRSGVVTRMVGATTDITHLKHAEELAQRAMEQATEANRAKDEFIAMLSHELRTPLTPVLMAATALEGDPSLPAQVREQLAMIRRNIGLEARLIDDLLDVSRIAHGKLELQQEIVDVHVAIEHALRNSASDLEARKLQLMQRLEAKDRLVRADAARLEEVFWNLIKNALKFTPAGGTITITTRNDEQKLVIEFADTGIGIAPEMQPRIFDAFDQGASKGISGGLGLGLAISKRIVELHGGSLSVASDGHGRGATFTVQLDALSAARLPAQTQPELGDGAAPQSARILIVEDHEDTARVMERILETAGYSVCVCRSIADARSAAARTSFDLVISDIGLPDGSGVDLMTHLRSKHDLNGIALSGFGTAEDIEASRAAGFAMHLTKPVDLEQLRGAIRKILRTKQDGASRREVAPV